MITKKVYILFLLILLRIQFCMAANTVVIPDANFRSFLMTNYSGVMVGPLLDTVLAAGVTGTLNCRMKSIADITGIQYFKGLTNIIISNNSITYLPALKNFTALNRLSCDTNLITSLPNINNLTNLLTFSCRKNNLSSLPALTGLANLEYLNCAMNSISSLPSLNGLSKLKTLDCSENQITQLPSLNALVNLENLFCGKNLLNTLPSLSNLTKLQWLYCSDNFLSNLPSLNNCPSLVAIRISNNKLTNLPNLSFASPPILVYLDYNNLTFEDLLPIAANSYYSGSFKLFPQNNFGNYTDTLIKKHGTFQFDLLVDASVGANNTYKWYRNGSLVYSGNSNSLTIPDVTYSDTGSYYAVVKNNNPAFVSDSVVSTIKKLKVADCFSGTGLKFTAESISCNEGFRLTIDAGNINGGTAPFTFVLTNLSNGEKIKTISPVMVGIKEGEYSLTIKDSAHCEASPVFCELTSGANCDPVFSPNGDGVGDTYFISTPGKAKIFNRNGIMVHELNTPAYWDGLDKTGAEVPSGYYAIIINEKSTTHVSLMR
jgi:internalin A